MSTWVISSSAAVGVAVGALLARPPELSAQLSLQEALESVFPSPAAIERRTAFLSEDDLADVQRNAGPDAPVTQSVVSYYLARRDGVPVGVAYFDSHRVRTLTEVVMIVVQPGAGNQDDQIRSIEVLRFAEPPEYHASRAWLDQFKGKSLNGELSLKGSISTMTGATLTSNAVTRAARRVLAIHRRIRPFQGVETRKR